MKVLVYYFIIAWLARVVCTFDVTEDMYLFLPFLQSQEPPPPCPPNELYKPCIGNCSDCIQRGICAIEECIGGCDCAPRFYRVTPDGPCEPVANCPKLECGENEIFRECGPICERCTTFKCHVINCDHKCYCKEGYLRNKQGVCIPQEECPQRKRCSHTEEWMESGPINEFCINPQNATANNDTQNVTACYCKEGYRRNTLGYCITETFCSLIQCPGAEIFYDCIPKCNTTCRNYGESNCTEDDNCYSGCFCPPDYVMNDFRTCVPLKNCSLDIKHILVEEESDAEEGYSDNNDDIANTTPLNETLSEEHLTESSTNVTSEISVNKSIKGELNATTENYEKSSVETEAMATNDTLKTVSEECDHLTIEKSESSQTLTIHEAEAQTVTVTQTPLEISTEYDEFELNNDAI